MSLSETAKNYIGVREYTSAHKQLVNEYNKIKPLPRGYKVSYSDAWCAVFASVVMSKNNCVNPPYECSANEMANKAKANGQFTSVPRENELIFYSWKRNGVVDHVGIVESVNGDTITTIEGNCNNMVKRRTISKHYVFIAGYALIKTKAKKATKTIAKDVIAGKYGNGDERRNKLTSAGYDYNEVQALVNKLLKG